MGRPSRFSPEARERAVRMVLDESGELDAIRQRLAAIEVSLCGNGDRAA